MRFVKRLASSQASRWLSTSNSWFANWQVFDTLIVCSLVANVGGFYFTVKRCYFDGNQHPRGVDELDKEVEGLSNDVQTLKAKLQDCLALCEKQKRELLILKADTSEQVYSLESTLQVMHSEFKSSQDVKNVHA